jgi:hypothetical protein
MTPLYQQDVKEDVTDLPLSVLSKLTTADLPDGASVQIGTMKDGVVHLDWNGTLVRDGEVLYEEADHTWTRKYWYSPLGLEQYLDLVRRAVETRHRTKRDVELTDHDDDGAFVTLRFRIETSESNLAAAYEAVRSFSPNAKNWTGKCGKNEFVTFHTKLENRSQRCTLGFLISWNGFSGSRLFRWQFVSCPPR